MDPLAAATAEAIRLHDFISGWFQGEIAEDRFAPDFADALHPNFENVQPSGAVLTRAGLLDPIRSARGTNPDFHIAIEEPRLLGIWPGLILFHYVEHQTGARASARENRRRATALFETEDRLTWRHLTEVGL